MITNDIISRLISDYKLKYNDLEKYDVISNLIVEEINNMSSETVDQIFDLYSVSIYHIDIFNCYYPGMYLPNYKNYYVHLVLYCLFIENIKE